MEPSLVPDARRGTDSSGSGGELRSDCPPLQFPTLSDSGCLASGLSPCAGLPLPEVLLYSFLAYLSAFFSHLQGQVADSLVLAVVMPQMLELSPGQASGTWGTAVIDTRGHLRSGGGRAPLPCLGHRGLRPAPSQLFPILFRFWPAPSFLPLCRAKKIKRSWEGIVVPCRSHWTVSGYYNKASKHSINLVEIHVREVGVTSQA